MGKWDTVRLGDVADIGAGQGAPQGDKYYSDSGKPFIKAGHLAELISGADEGLIKRVNDDVAKSHKLKIYPKGTILFAKSGMSCLKGYVYQLKNESYVVNHLACVKPRTAHSAYIKYFFLYSPPNQLIKDDAYPSISLSDISNIIIPLPPLDVQQKIADVLDKASALIKLRKAQLDKLDLLVKSHFIEMFDDPVANPLKWEVRSLKSLSIKILSGNTPKGGNQVYVDEGITFFRSQNVWKNKLELDDIAYIDEETHRKMSNSSLKKGDILITKTGRINTENSSLGRAALFRGENDRANINGHVYLVRLKKNIVNEFVLYILITDEYREYIRKVCVGGIDKRQINKEHLEEFPIIVPPLELQTRFADFVQQIDKSKITLQQSLEKLERNYKSLMQKCFRGDLF